MSPTTPSRRRARLQRSDWVAAALEAIARGGLAAVAIEPLAARLGVTKGSFYAHFSSRDDLIEAALHAWELSHGAEASGESDGHVTADAATRITQALRAGVAFSQDRAPSVHINLIGELHDPRVRAAVANVTAQRVERLTVDFRELGFSAAHARRRARLLYAAYLGLLQMARETPEERMSPAEIRRLVAEVEATLIAPPAR